MTTEIKNPLIGTFEFKEIEGKTYKLLIVDEVSTDDLLVDRLWRENILNELGVVPNKSAALIIIDEAIRKENEFSSKTDLRYWGYDPDSHQVVSYAKYESHLRPFTAAHGQKVIDTVVDKLGVDIFRIACGIKK